MTVDDYVHEKAPYFHYDVFDVLAPLDPEEYSELLELIEQAIHTT